MKKVLQMLMGLMLISSFIFAQDETVQKGLYAITLDVLKGQLEFLASDWTEGRGTGERGIYMAADYISSMFKVYGVKPAGDWTEPSYWEIRQGVKDEKTQSYFQNFNAVEYSPADNQEFSLLSNDGNSKTKITFKYKTDFSVRTSDIGREISAPIVFVGYGLVNEKHKYNDLDDEDIDGKIILRLSGYPGHKDTSSAAYKKFHPKGRWASWQMRREKNKNAKKYGAVAILEITKKEDISANWAVNYPFRFNKPYYEGDEDIHNNDANLRIQGDTLDTSPAIIYISQRIANKLIEGTNIDFDKFEQQAKTRMKPSSRIIKDKSLFIKTDVNSRIKKLRNVLGKIEGENSDEIIVVGAHYDHLGTEKGYIWNGADDDASGTVGMMTIAKAFLATGVKPKKTIIFAAWTGEEWGLLGSEYFVNNTPFDRKNIHYNLNLDMISRSSEKDTLENKCSVYFSSDYSQIQEIVNKYNKELGINLDLEFDASKRPSDGSDHASFSEKDIPVGFFITAPEVHDDYHRPSDHVEKVNWEKFQKVVKLGFMNIWEFANIEGKLTKSPVPEKKEE